MYLKHNIKSSSLIDGYKGLASILNLTFGSVNPGITVSFAAFAAYTTQFVPSPSAAPTLTPFLAKFTHEYARWT